MQHQGTRVLETQRILLRPFRAEDAEAMFRNWASDTEVTKYLTWQTHKSPEDTRALCAAWEAASEKPDCYQWAVVLKELGEPVGSLSVVRMREEIGSVELGYCIGRAWWHKGLVAEAVQAVIDFLFRDVGVNRIAACHDVRNPNSGRVMQKVGMRYDGTLRGAGRNNQGVVDEVWYSLLAEDYFGSAAPAFRPMSRIRQAMSAEDCIALLKREKRGVLSVLGDGGYPYGVPINHWYDPEDGKIYFHSGPVGHKIDSIRQANRASFCVMDAGTREPEGWALNFRSVIVFGRLEMVEDHERALEISRQISYKFTQDQAYIEQEVRSSGASVLCFALTPEHITGKRVNEK